MRNLSQPRPRTWVSAARMGASPQPIVGGTGAYAGARGTIKTTKPMKGYDSADLITING